MSRRAKIVCTLGPATSSQEQITALIDAGLDVARLNLSHGTRADHLLAYQRVRAGSDATGRSVGMLADLQGPKIRLGTFPGGPIRLNAGDEFIITTDDIPGTEREAATTYQGLADDVRAGDRILIDDGNVQLDVTGVTGSRVRTRVVVGGKVSDHKGINLPGVSVSAPALTDKDESDLRWALATGVDMIALSFVRTPDDASLARKIMREGRPPGRPADRQDREARGRERPAEHRRRVRRDHGRARRPRRRASPGTGARGPEPGDQPGQGAGPAGHRGHPDAGVDDQRAASHPGRGVRRGRRGRRGRGRGDAVRGDQRGRLSDGDRGHDGADRRRGRGELSAGGALPHRMPTTTGGAIARAAAEVGAIVGAKALVAFTMTGETARRLARYRSPVPLLAFTTEAATRSQLALTWGVETFIVSTVRHTDDMVHEVDAALVNLGRCAIGDKIVIVAGSPPGSPGKTNALRVHRIGAGSLPLGEISIENGPYRRLEPIQHVSLNLLAVSRSTHLCNFSQAGEPVSKFV